MLAEIIGEHYLLGVPIEMGTRFEADLELESIELVALTAKLTERYGDRVNFVAFLADKELDEIIELTVGQIVSYISDSLNAAARGSR
jgi:acyl carrier protein